MVTIFIISFIAPCGGKVCKNGGTLNTGTCTCACVPPYTGSTCATGIYIMILELIATDYYLIII
jgi:hypothetical protein